MRNIYEIISEQKAIVDVNIANYDLMYTTNIFVKENEYIQEGFGDKVKSIVKSVVEFIKSLIVKIREFVSKLFNFFRGGKNEVAKIENKLKEAKGDGDKKEEAKGSDKGNATSVGEAGTLSNISFTGEATTLPQLLKVTKGKATTTKIGPIVKKLELVERIEDLGELFDNLGEMDKMISGSKDVKIMSRLAKKIMAGDENNENPMEKIKADLGDSDENVQFEISSKSNEIIQYLEYGQKLGVNLKAAGNEVTAELNESVREIESVDITKSPDPKKAEQILNLLCSELRFVSNLISSSISYAGQKALKGYTQYLRICRRLCDMYISSRLPNIDNRTKTKSRNQMINSVEKKDIIKDKYGSDEE